MAVTYTTGVERRAHAARYWTDRLSLSALTMAATRVAEKTKPVALSGGTISPPTVSDASRDATCSHATVSPSSTRPPSAISKSRCGIMATTAFSRTNTSAATAPAAAPALAPEKAAAMA